MGVWSKAKTADKGIEAWLGAAGYGYASLVELGNLFQGLDDWPARYDRLLAGSGELLTERLLALPGPVCLLCAEKRPAECHRRLVAEWVAGRHGFEVRHLG